jgi:uncharacterized membrane protein
VPADKKRVVFIDLLRLLATFQMVQGHSIDAVLDAGLRSGSAYGAWSWARGLTSVAFLFAAGVSFHLATLSRFEAHRSSPRAIRRRVKRGLMIVAIGYLLHNPFHALSSGEWGPALAHAAIVDVLQCIGVSILLLEALTLSLRSPRQVVIASGLLAVACVLLWPFTEGASTDGALAWATNYLTHAGGSIFPLFPWAGYLFTGLLVGAIACPDGKLTKRGVYGLFLFGGGVMLASRLVRFLPYADGLPDPGPGLFKLSVVVLISAVLALATASRGAMPRAFTILASETLVIYVVHVSLLYGAGYGLADLVGPTASLGTSIWIALGMVLLSAAVGLGWHRIKGIWSGRRGGPTALARGLKAG